jgi:outer membrane murein-binding lipoprotein Lpp
MNTKTIRRMALGCCVTGGLLAAGCGGSAEESTSDAASNVIAETAVKAALSESHKNVEVDIKGDGVHMSGTAADGTQVSMTTGEGTKLPADFPKDVPVPADLVLNMATSASEGSSVQGSSKMTMDALTAFYRKEAVAQGWTEAMNFGQPGEMQTLQYTKENRSLGVMIVKDEAGAMVTITVGNN